MIRLGPTLCVESFTAVSFAETSAAAGRDIRLLVPDADRTVVPHGERTVSEAYLDHCQTLGEEYRADAATNDYDIFLAMMSNAGTKTAKRRIEYIAAQIAEAARTEVPAITSYEIGHLKPHPAMPKAVSERTGVPIKSMAVVGDQLGKDILGGVLVQCGATVLVAPLGPSTHEHWATRTFQRPVEALARPFLSLPFSTSKFARGRTPFLMKGEATLPVGSQGYRKAEMISYAGTALLAGLGIGEILNHEILAGIVSEASAIGLTDMARVMGQRQKTHVLDRMQDLIDKSERHT